MTPPSRRRRPTAILAPRAGRTPPSRTGCSRRYADAEARAAWRLGSWLVRASSLGVAGDASIRLRACLGPILLADRGQTAALCGLLGKPAAARLASIDVATNPLCGLIVTTFDGDLGALLSLIAREGADADVRTEALAALGYLTATARLMAGEVVPFLEAMGGGLDAARTFPLAVCWAMLVAFLGLGDLEARARKLLGAEADAPRASASEWFDQERAEAASHPSAASRFEDAGFGPLRGIDTGGHRRDIWAGA